MPWPFVLQRNVSECCIDAPIVLLRLATKGRKGCGQGLQLTRQGP